MLTQINTLFGGFAETKEVNGSSVVAVASDKQADYKRIREDVGIFPMTFTTYYKITGDEAEEVLDNLLTKSVQYLNYGQNRLCYFLNESGEIAAFVTLFKNDENFIIEAFEWDAQAIEAIFAERNLTFDKLNYSCILLEGLKTVEFMTESMELTVDYFVFQSHQELDVFGKDIIVARTGYTGEFGYKLIGEADRIEAIWGNLLPAHKDKVVGYDAFEMCLYEIKQPCWTLPYLAISNNAFELDYQWFVDFKKDIDYVGKEALLNTKFNEASRRLIGATADAASEVDDEVKLEGEVVGKVVDSRFAAGVGKYVTMLLVDQKYAHAHIEMETASGQKLLTASAPYMFPDSWFANR